MKLKSLRLVNFRNYSEALVRFESGVNVIYGGNGQGKTNIVEAVYMLALAQSHRNNNDRELIKFNNDSLLIEGNFDDGRIDEVLKIEVRRQSGNKFRKLLYRDDFLLQKYADFVGSFNAVMFAPEDLLLVKEGPSLRRQLINRLLSQSNRTYLLILQQLNRILQMRNHLLKDLQQENLHEVMSLLQKRRSPLIVDDLATDSEVAATTMSQVSSDLDVGANEPDANASDTNVSDMNGSGGLSETAERSTNSISAGGKFAYLQTEFNKGNDNFALLSKIDSLLIWNEKFAAIAAKIIKYRMDLVAELNAFVRKIHAALSADKEELILKYQTVSGIEPEDDLESIQLKLAEKLVKSVQLDILKGHTTYGPQRDDLEFYINDKNCRLYASQGQQRTAVLALKMAECDYIKAVKHCDPVLILDDVLSELDEMRRTALFATISNSQVLLTCTDLGQFDEKWLQHTNFNYINVINGEIV